MMILGVGDYVIFHGKQQSIGRIEEILPSETKNSPLFKYIAFCYPEETGSRLVSHGKHEIFKTPLNRTATLDDVEAKVRVVKLSDYLRMPKNERFSSDCFFCRQIYNPTDKSFVPDLDTCFCSRLINPDEEIMMCECESLYHLQCINENGLCKICSTSLNLTQGILLGSDMSGETFYDEFISAVNRVCDEPCDSDEKLCGFKGQKSLQKKSQSSDIRKEATKRINAALVAFSTDHLEKNLSDIERHRKSVQKLYYESLLYGIEEVKQNQSSPHKPRDKKLEVLRDPQENFKIAQDLAGLIESCVWEEAKYQIVSYNLKNRELSNYLADRDNYWLRVSLLTGEKKPEDLIVNTGQELLSKRRIKKIEGKAQAILKQSVLNDASTHADINFNRPDVVEKFDKMETEDETLARFINEIGKEKATDSYQLGLETEDNSVLCKEMQIESKLVDLDVLNLVLEYSFDKVCEMLTARMKKHLKPGVCERILELMKKKENEFYAASLI